MLQLEKLVVGSWGVNCYLVIDEATKHAVLVDPGDEAEKILAWVEKQDVSIERILLTHGHFDHVGALDAVRKALNVLVGLHKADQAHFGLDADFDLEHGDRVEVGEGYLQVVFIPGHTPGSVAFILAEGDGFFTGDRWRCDLPRWTRQNGRQCGFENFPGVAGTRGL
jgi:hydroxyacylglutathione hydrolase